MILSTELRDLAGPGKHRRTAADCALSGGDYTCSWRARRRRIVFLKYCDTRHDFTLSLSFPLKILHPVSDLGFPWGVRAAIQRKPDEAHEFCASWCRAQTLLIHRQPLIDIALDHCQQVLIFLVDQVKLHACEMPNGFPDMDGNPNHHTAVAGFEVTRVQAQIDVIVIEGGNSRSSSASCRSIDPPSSDYIPGALQCLSM